MKELRDAILRMLDENESLDEALSRATDVAWSALMDDLHQAVRDYDTARDLAALEAARGRKEEP